MSSEAQTSSSVSAQGGSIEQLRAFARQGYLYALSDGAYCAQFLADLPETAIDVVIPLLRPHPTADPQAIPLLIKVGEQILDAIVGKMAGEPWGTFVMSKASPETLRVHFRHFLVVELPDGEQWYFRFYDPRLLPTYLANCNEWELQKFFGPVRAFGIPTASDPGITILHYDSQRADRSSTDPYVSLVWHIRPEQARALSGMGD